MVSHELPEPTTTLAGTVAFRIGALHGLILALVFADAQLAYNDLREAIADEADDLDRLDDPQAPRLRHALREYAEEVVGEEWAALDRSGLSERAWQIFDLIELGVLDLEADDERERTLRSQLLQDLDAVSDFRHARLFFARRTLPTVFWYVALLGFALTVSLFFVHRATPLHVLMLAA